MAFDLTIFVQQEIIALGFFHMFCLFYPDFSNNIVQSIPHIFAATWTKFTNV